MSNQSTDDLLNSILNGTVDDLSDVPQFAPFPVGTHRANLSLEMKKIGNNHGVEAKFVAIETIELTNADDKPLVAGDSTTLLYFLVHPNEKTMEIGQGQFKELVKTLNAHFGDRTNGEVIQSTKDVEVMITTGLREGKEKGKFYTDLKALVVA